MDSDMLHKEMDIPSMNQCIWYIKLNITHQLQRITYQFTHNISETRHMTLKFSAIVDGFGHGAYIFVCKMNEY